MTTDTSHFQQNCLQEGLSKIESRKEGFATRFYENLFLLRPDVQPLFEKTDMQKQQQMLISALFLIVRNAQNPSLFTMVLHNLGERHIGYGTVGHCFPDMAQALVKTFSEFIGPDWTIEQERAWLTAFAEINRLMLEGIAQANQ